MYRIINNVLEENLFLSFKNEMMSEETSWFYRDTMTAYDKNNFFMHCFYVKNEIQSNLYHSFIPHILDRINCVSLVIARANLVLKKETVFKSAYHVDMPFKCKTGIFYLNNCNGYTELKDGIIIPNQENSIVLFDSNIEHRSVSQTDTNRRIVVNINFFENNRLH
jgi:hypothetical protein